MCLDESVQPYNAFVTDAVKFSEMDFFMEFSDLALACILGKVWKIYDYKLICS